MQKGYEVHGILRRSSSFNTGRIEHLYFDEWVRDMKQKRTINLHYADMTDSSSLIRVIQMVQPDEIYNLAAQSHVKVSFDVPEYTAEADAIGTLRMLEAVRILGLEKKTRIYQASTSELYGKVQEVPQSETTPFYPRSPYAVAKQYGFWITKNYRESYGMFAVNGILFNHESERRGETFVTRKITFAAARIVQGEQDKLYLGNLDARRDWGYAKDYVECMWLILQHDVPEDFVIATGEMHTVREFCTLAFAEAGINLRWEGKGLDEKGIDTATGKVLVEVDPKYFRPAEVEQLLGNPTKAKTVLGGLLIQDMDQQLLDGELKYVTNRRPSEKELEDLLFAWKVVKHTKSNAIAIAKDKCTTGVGPGQVSRIWALENAIRQGGGRIAGSVMASDAFFPFADCVEAAHKAGITAIIQPGGSIHDQDSIDAANKYNIAMIFTGMRHFKH